jgi:hypothetical protein
VEVCGCLDGGCASMLWLLGGVWVTLRGCHFVRCVCVWGGEVCCDRVVGCDCACIGLRAAGCAYVVCRYRSCLKWMW